MATSEDERARRVVVDNDGHDIVVVTELPPRSAPVRAGSAPAGPGPTDPAPAERGVARRGRWLLPVAGAVLLALSIALVGWLAGRDDVVVAGPGDAGPAAPAAAGAPAPLAVSVRAPSAAVAGQPATFTVSYTDGAGKFTGSTEEWGDGVGAGSVAQGSCEGLPDGGAPGKGSYVVTHTWPKAGTYNVKIAVSSMTCKGGAPVDEQAATTLTVRVAAR
jgi:hypothetical protein